MTPIYLFWAMKIPKGGSGRNIFGASKQNFDVETERRCVNLWSDRKINNKKLLVNAWGNLGLEGVFEAGRSRVYFLGPFYDRQASGNWSFRLKVFQVLHPTLSMQGPGGWGPCQLRPFLHIIINLLGLD